MTTRQPPAGGIRIAQNNSTSTLAAATTVIDNSRTATPPANDHSFPTAEQAEVICQASSIEIGIGGDGSDPFDATLLLAGPDTMDREIAVWTRLTPPVMTDLLEQLQDLLLAQQESLGITTDTVNDSPTGAADDPDPNPDGEQGRVKRLLDPMGLRHLRNRSSRSTILLAIGIASLLLLTVIVQLVRP